MLLAEFSLTPLDKGPSVSPWVSRSLDIIDQSGVPYRLGPMGTCVEGEWDEVMRAFDGLLLALRRLEESLPSPGPESA